MKNYIVSEEDNRLAYLKETRQLLYKNVRLAIVAVAAIGTAGSFVWYSMIPGYRYTRQLNEVYERQGQSAPFSVIGDLVCMGFITLAIIGLCGVLIASIRDAYRTYRDIQELQRRKPA